MMRFPAFLTAASLCMLLGSFACQRNVVVTTPTDAPPAGTSGITSTPAPASANTVEPTPSQTEAQFDNTKRPAWLEKRIQYHLNEKKQNPPIQIMSYLYKGKRVYYETVGCCDQYTNLYTSDGKLLCHPDGGLTGRGDGQCTDFADARTEERVVWQDPR
ncbi:hypothetical protein SAMN06265337_3563 [Hymenobacter gelipurpurascens]|uniref:DUF6970 domain-containing protein n=1 Tax=Hymenobacter gelipurpurascens TaxID=89968 RepID=A0A212UEV9_9BACT|nr:hypothetical protein [Hymenobacter gelipurpurascens]SNC76789.1 hypothetical protein SAMN06265337_3563 [Hymenobacter gelipurpurascens]